MCEWDDAVHEIVSTFWKTSYLQLRHLLFRYNISYMKAEVLLWESYLVFQDNKLELYVGILLLKEERNAIPFDPKSHPIKKQTNPNILCDLCMV